MEIREITAQERAEKSLPVQAYAFQASPADDALDKKLREGQRYYEGNVTLVAEENGFAMADASAIPMQQNVRGKVFPMAGVAGVATLPLARRRGYARALLARLLGQMRETGHVVSALYPFRPSFYERFGFVGLPRTRTVRFSPACVAHLLRAELPGEVTCERIKPGYSAYRDFTLQLLADVHGFSVLPDYRSVDLPDADDRWLVMAYDDGEPIAAATYRITGYAGVLAADDMLVANSLGRAVLLQFFGRHVDQVSEIEVQVPPGELPELWATDLAAVTQAVTSFPASPAPMARVLSVTALTGMPAGRERLAVEVTGDPYMTGRYVLDGMTGSLEATQSTRAPEATLTAAGLSALVYGVLDPDDVVVRGLGQISRDASQRLRRLFIRCHPYLYARF